MNSNILYYNLKIAYYHLITLSLRQSRKVGGMFTYVGRSISDEGFLCSSLSSTVNNPDLHK